MAQLVLSKETLIRKLDDLPPEAWPDLAAFIEFWIYKTQKSTNGLDAQAHPAFGIWRDHAEIGDDADATGQFSLALRRAIENRHDGELSHRHNNPD
ncbi:MAG: hypothetical protein KIH69_007025 [Anaerolineae bacterium]|nr:hypothetical protein [Anaerolineae bacterium]